MNKIYDYSLLTLEELISKISSARFFHLPKMVAEALRKLNSTPSYEPSYKVYTALLTQSGTNAPIAIELENSTGLTPIFTYISIGKYGLQLGQFINKDKIQLLIGQPRFVSTLGESATVSYEFVDDNTNAGAYQILTKQTINSTGVTTLQNNYLYRTPIEIRVYN